MPEPLPVELNLQGEAVAIVVAETEDLAEDAAAAIKVDYEVLPFASMLKDSMAPDAPDLGHGKGNLIRHANSPKDFPHATWADQRGDLEQGFAEADVIKEFTLSLYGRRFGSDAAEWQRRQMGRRQLTIWGMGQGIYPPRAALADALGIDVSKIRFINKWNGSTFGAARMAAETILSAHRASRESHWSARQGHAAEGSGTGATADQAGDHHQFPSGSQERRPHRGHRLTKYS